MAFWCCMVIPALICGIVRPSMSRPNGVMICCSFAANATLMGSKESKRTVRLYNRLARALVEFEALWYATWLRGVEGAAQGLQAPLLVQHPQSGMLVLFIYTLHGLSTKVGLESSTYTVAVWRCISRIVLILLLMGMSTSVL